MRGALAAAVGSVAATRGGEREQRRLPRWVPIAIVLGLLAGLAIAALRVDLIRVRYGLAESLETERALLEERRSVLAQVRSLRDPARLAGLAERRNFGRPARIVDLPVAPPTPAKRELW